MIIVIIQDTKGNIVNVLNVKNLDLEELWLEHNPEDEIPDSLYSNSFLQGENYSFHFSEVTN